MFIRLYLSIVGTLLVVASTAVGIYAWTYEDKLISPLYEIEANVGELKALVISDVHNHLDTYDDGSSMTSYINSLDVDYVFFTGDLMDSHTTNFDYLVPVLEAIQSKGIEGYYVHGNHEVELENNKIAELESLLDSYGLNNVNNKTFVLDENFTISGVKDPSIDIFSDPAALMRENLEEVSQNLDKTRFNILLAHQPGYTMLYSQYGFDLAISGHTHGGQGSLLGRALFSSSEYYHGLYNRGNFYHLVSGGCGYSYHLPFRFNGECEIPYLVMQ